MIKPSQDVLPHHRNFHVAVYARVYEVLQMADPQWLESHWKTISNGVKVDKVYLETHRDLKIASDELLETLKKFFADRGVKTAGGITLTVNEANRFQTFCYTTPADRKKVKEIVEHTAKHFDEIILDDFFFTNCKCENCIRAKGNRSWTDFRIDLMRKVAEELVLKPAKAVNPKVRVTIKYPNWYEHFQGLGFDLEKEPQMFDSIYTGTETRQPTYNAQHLQQYHGYSIVRYFENIAPKRNLGGWVDTGGMRTVDRYAEQLWLTLFAKAPEITLFDWRQVVRPIRSSDQGGFKGASFDFDKVAKPFRQADGTMSAGFVVATVAGAALDGIDPVLGKLGNPIGVASYRPPHAIGEDFLQSYIGMLGVPIELSPTFPTDAKAMFLTESAAFDPDVASKIEHAVRNGANVTITSGLLDALQNRRIRHIFEGSVGKSKVLTDEFYLRGAQMKSDGPILLPQLEYLTNDAWEMVGASANGYPLLLQAPYGKGMLNVVAIPDNFMDLYRIPIAALDSIRTWICHNQVAHVEGPTQICLFAYDNDALVVESFRDHPEEVRVVTASKFHRLQDVVTGEIIEGATDRDREVFHLTIGAHAYRAFTAITQ
jgi:hypothetical protein